MDDRIGTINSDGSRAYPKTDVYGGAVHLPSTIHKLTSTLFVVLPVNFVDNGILAELRGVYTPTLISPRKPLKDSEDES